MENQFIKARTLSDYIISFSLILLGILLLILSLSSSMLIAGAMILIVGVVLFFVLKSVWKDKATKDVYQQKVHYYKKSQKADLLKTFDKNLKGLREIKQEESAEKSLRLDVYYCEKADKLYCRLYEYVPYEYAPVTPLLAYSFDQVRQQV